MHLQNEIPKVSMYFCVCCSISFFIIYPCPIFATETRSILLPPDQQQFLSGLVELSLFFESALRNGVSGTERCRPAELATSAVYPPSLTVR